MPNKFEFSKKNYLNWEIQYYPNSLNYKQIIDAIDKFYKKKNLIILKEYFNNLNFNFSFIASYKNFTLACVDHISSYPIYYTKNNNSLFFAPNIYDLNIDLKNNNFNKQSELEILMAGYVTEDRTLIKNIFQLEAGSFAISPEKKIIDYYLHYPSKNLNVSSDIKLIKDIDEILNNIFKNIYNKYADYKIIVPLSGGLDSRLILGKLKEIGFNNITAISYGPKYNSEAKLAKIVAKKLNIPWLFLVSKKKIAKKLFYLEEFANYLKYSCNYSRSPNMQEFHFLYDLSEKKIINKKTLIINGQTGDFISGGHIPKSLILNPESKENMIKYIIDKHYSLWQNLRTGNNLDKIINLLNNYKSFENINLLENKLNYAYMYNLWEWRERQSKFVINQQKIYDFYNVYWELPLWNAQFINFWRNLPLKHLENKKLYIKYLDHWNYKNIFLDKKINYTRLDRQEINRWPGFSYFLFIIGKVLGLLFGKNFKYFYYNYFKYFGHYSNYYQSFGYRQYLKHAKNIRNPQSLFALKYLKDIKNNKNNK